MDKKNSFNKIVNNNTKFETLKNFHKLNQITPKKILPNPFLINNNKFSNDIVYCDHHQTPEILKAELFCTECIMFNCFECNYKFHKNCINNIDIKKFSENQTLILKDLKENTEKLFTKSNEIKNCEFISEQILKSNQNFIDQLKAIKECIERFILKRKDFQEKLFSSVQLILKTELNDKFNNFSKNLSDCI